MKKYIKDLREKEHVQTVFLCTEKNSGADRNGKAFLSLTLADSSGHINARMFEKADEAAGGFEVGDAVKIKGFVQLFQSRKQVIVNDVRKATEDEYTMTELVAELGGDPREHMEQLLKLVNDLDNVHVRELLGKTLQDAEVSARLLKAPAAKTIHHAYRGGLIEHIHSIAQMMVTMGEHYPFLDRNLLVFGAIYHDLGKIFELDLSEGIHYTQSGRLVGHMVLATDMIERLTQAMPDFPEDLRDVLKHIVLSHHGKLEYGSPKLPMLPEAIVINMIDDLDSKMNTLFHFLKNEIQNVPADQKWSHFHAGFERYFFLDFFRRRASRS